VAYGAHIGGFLAGMALALVLRMTGTREQPSRLSRSMATDPRNRTLW
jgi:membrane associated rhomboid family serine protease